jgi:hypothetical protein
MRKIDRKYCRDCHDDYYNDTQPDGCWNRKEARLIWRIPIGLREKPPYLNKKSVRVPDCWHGQGSSRLIYIEKKALTRYGYWR